MDVEARDDFFLFAAHLDDVCAGRLHYKTLTKYQSQGDSGFGPWFLRVSGIAKDVAHAWR